MLRRFFFAILLAAMLQACQPTNTTPSVPAPTENATPVATTSPSLTIYYEENAQYEIVGPEDPRLFIDIWDLTALVNTPRPQDILLTSSPEGHRNNTSFQHSFPGAQLEIQQGSLSATGISVTGITSRCKETDPWGSNIIYRVEMAGMHIAVMGEIGQSRLTEEQLTALGPVDIAIMQMENYDCGMDTTNQYAFQIIDQIQPKLILMTQSNWQSVGLAAKKWPTFALKNSMVIVNQSQLMSPTRMLILGVMAPTYQKLNHLATWQ